MKIGAIYAYIRKGEGGQRNEKRERRRVKVSVERKDDVIRGRGHGVSRARKSNHS